MISKAKNVSDIYRALRFSFDPCKDDTTRYQANMQLVHEASSLERAMPSSLDGNRRSLSPTQLDATKVTYIDEATMLEHGIEAAAATTIADTQAVPAYDIALLIDHDQGSD